MNVIGLQMKENKKNHRKDSETSKSKAPEQNTDQNRASFKMKVTWYSYRIMKSTLVIGSTAPPSSRKIPI